MRNNLSRSDPNRAQTVLDRRGHELKVKARTPTERRQLRKRFKNPDAEPSGVVSAGVLFACLAPDVHACVAASCNEEEMEWQQEKSFFWLVRTALTECLKTGISMENSLKNDNRRRPKMMVN